MDHFKLEESNPHKMTQMNRQIPTRRTQTQMIRKETSSSHREKATRAVQATVQSTPIRNKRTRAKPQAKVRTTPAQAILRQRLTMSQMITFA